MEDTNYLLHLQTCTDCAHGKRDLDEDRNDDEIMPPMKKRTNRNESASVSSTTSTSSSQAMHATDVDESNDHEQALDKEEIEAEMPDSQTTDISNEMRSRTTSPFSDETEFVKEADDEINPNKLHFELQQYRSGDVHMPEKTSCSSLSLHEAFRMFCCKWFIVNEDYILFPYGIKNDQDILQRPLNTRVSYILKHKGERYIPMKKILQSLDPVLNADTGSWNDPVFLDIQQLFLDQTRLGDKKQNMPEKIRDFMETLTPIFEQMIDMKNEESKFRTMFGKFIEIVKTNVFIEHKCTSKHHSEINFPLKKTKLVISGRPDILITKLHGGHVVAVVESKKYHPMRNKFEDVPNPHGVKVKVKKTEEASKVQFQGKQGEEEKEPTKVQYQYHGILKNANEKKVKVLNEKFYTDLDSNICRYMTEHEKKYLDHFISQVVGEILSCFGEQDKKALHLNMQRPDLPKKVVRYGIGQVGFKVIFVTVGLNGAFVGSSKTPYIEVKGIEAHGLDIFSTRPLDLMLAEERAIIADILYALFA